MGVGNVTIVRMMALQVTLAVFVGFGLGVGAASISGNVLGGTGLAFQMPWQVPVIGLACVLLCCLLAGVLSIGRVLRLEPAVVFR